MPRLFASTLPYIVKKQVYFTPVTWQATPTLPEDSLLHLYTLTSEAAVVLAMVCAVRGGRGSFFTECKVPLVTDGTALEDLVAEVTGWDKLLPSRDFLFHVSWLLVGKCFLLDFFNDRLLPTLLLDSEAGRVTSTVMWCDYKTYGVAPFGTCILLTLRDDFFMLRDSILTELGEFWILLGLLLETAGLDVNEEMFLGILLSEPVATIRCWAVLDSADESSLECRDGDFIFAVPNTFNCLCEFLWGCWPNVWNEYLPGRTLCVGCLLKLYRNAVEQYWIAPQSLLQITHVYCG